MAHCPQCKTEYEEETRECADCHVPLVAGSLPGESIQEIPRDSELVQVHVFSGGTAFGQAALAKSWLESEGIPCVLPGEASAGMLPVLDVPVLVREEDAERAEEILKEYLDSSAPVSLEDELQ